MRNTDEILTSLQSEETVRIIDIHIYEQEPQQEPPCVESDLESEEPAATNESQQDQQEPARPRHHYTPPVFVLAGLASIFLMSVLITVFLLPLLATPTVTITLVPLTKEIDTTQQITVSTDARAGSVPGRSLSQMTMSQQKTVPTTGQQHQNATQAQGRMTFYNMATSPQQIATGTLLVGADGVQVVTDQTALLPAGNLAINGQATVTAHAIIAGPQGNIAGGDIYGPCCRQSIQVVSGAFTGGHDARDYRAVQQKDIDAATSDLQASLLQSAQAAFQQQVRVNETLITPLPCHLTSTPDHPNGAEAQHVTITVSTTCRGMVYNAQAMHQQVAQTATQEAMKQLGNGYTVSGMPTTTITQATPKGGNDIVLQMNNASYWRYQLTDQQERQLITQIAGKSRSAATDLLLHSPGIESVAIDATTLPTDTQHIRVMVVYAG